MDDQSILGVVHCVGCHLLETLNNSGSHITTQAKDAGHLLYLIERVPYVTLPEPLHQALRLKEISHQPIAARPPPRPNGLPLAV